MALEVDWVVSNESVGRCMLLALGGDCRAGLAIACVAPLDDNDRIFEQS